MSVVFTGAVRNYTGLSTDTKPILASEVAADRTLRQPLPIGSTFRELDTGNAFVWSGQEWVGQPSQGTEDRLTAQMMIALTDMNAKFDRMLFIVSSYTGIEG